MSALSPHQFAQWEPAKNAPDPSKVQECRTGKSMGPHFKAHFTEKARRSLDPKTSAEFNPRQNRSN
jgi:hypothetical protein